MSSKVPCDDHAHGTHTIGTAVGYGGADKTIGVAPQAKWIGCRNMDNLTGSVTTYLECFEFFFAPYPVGGDSFTQGRVELAPDIINNSWACPNKEGCEGDEFIHTLKVLMLCSIMVVSAAGNSGDRCSSMDMTPAHNSGLSLRVGGLNQPYKRVFGLSSRGPSKFDGGTGPEVIAPATFIVSSTPKGRYAGQFWSGTSMAAPHVAGLVALIWQASPKLKGNIEQTIELIQKSATPFPWNQNCGDIPGDKFPNNIVGSGVINAYKAVQMALRIK
jgi:subtilisin family serine protease